MIKLLFTTVLFLSLISVSTSQTLIYKGKIKVYSTQGQRLSSSEINKLFAVNSIVSDAYNEGRNKKIIGGTLMFGGLSLITIDFIRALKSDVNYPSTLTILGALAFAVSIPVKIGYSKKIKESIDQFNKIYPDGNTSSISENKLEFIANGNGLGLRFSLN